ncbi:MAG: radical SAM protein [Candidatus Brocadiaceae bacterium]|jgi:putative pyruvate formate lyase activating enzyme
MDAEPTEERVASAYELAGACRICPRDCGVNRHEDQRGYCGIGRVPLLASAGPHFGEEPCLVGRGGSGTIFLAGCNLLCVFCQNYDISHGRAGSPAEPERIAGTMMALEGRGCENINFVTPSHVAPWLMDAVRRARLQGLRVPIVYNCGGYEALETLRLLEGTVDIYMPDAKFWGPETADRYTGAPDYPERMREALREMHRQVGDLQVEGGVARRGLLVRHLVMPEHVDESEAILRFLAAEVSPNTHVNVMQQYRPVYRAGHYPEIDRTVTAEEYARARGSARGLGLCLV